MVEVATRRRRGGRAGGRSCAGSWLGSCRGRLVGIGRSQEQVPLPGIPVETATSRIRRAGRAIGGGDVNGVRREDRACRWAGSASFDGAGCGPGAAVADGVSGVGDGRAPGGSGVVGGGQVPGQIGVDGPDPGHLPAASPVSRVAAGRERDPAATGQDHADQRPGRGVRGSGGSDGQEEPPGPEPPGPSRPGVPCGRLAWGESVPAGYQGRPWPGAGPARPSAVPWPGGDALIGGQDFGGGSRPASPALPESSAQRSTLVRWAMCSRRFFASPGDLHDGPADRGTQRPLGQRPARSSTMAFGGAGLLGVGQR